MIARRSTNSSTPAGTVSRPIKRTPSDAWSQNAWRSRGPRSCESGTNVVAIETARRPGRTKNVNAPK